MVLDEFDRLPWEPMPEDDVYGDELVTLPGPTQEISACCGATIRDYKMKGYCNQCSRIVYTCCD